MTLKARNLFINLFFTTSVIFLAIASICFIWSLTKGHIIQTPSEYRINFSTYNFHAVIISLATMIIFVACSLMALGRYFNHTQATEIIYVWIFLIGILADSMRIFIISFNLWQTYSNALIVMTKIVLFGRILTLASLFFVALANDITESKNIERNLFILFMISIFISTIIPLNTSKIESTGMVVQGFKITFHVVKMIFVITTFIAFLLNSMTKDTNETKRNTRIIAFSYLGVVFGYLMLSSSDNLPCLIMGTILLFSGMFFFLFHIHKLYLWQ